MATIECRSEPEDDESATTGEGGQGGDWDNLTPAERRKAALRTLDKVAAGFGGRNAMARVAAARAVLETTPDAPAEEEKDPRKRLAMLELARSELLRIIAELDAKERAGGERGEK